MLNSLSSVEKFYTLWSQHSIFNQRYNVNQTGWPELD